MRILQKHHQGTLRHPPVIKQRSKQITVYHDEKYQFLR